MGLSFNIPQLKEQLTNGVHNCTVISANVLRNDDGSFVTVAADICIVVSFSCGELIHEVLFRIAYDNEYRLYTKLLALAGINFNRFDFNKDKLVGTKVAVFVKKIYEEIKISSEENKFYYKVVNFKPLKNKGTYTFKSAEYL